jgi:phage shock protein PspC (stress-responsive transcriptional regulator)
MAQEHIPEGVKTEPKAEPKAEHKTEPKTKKLYRNRETGKIAGVCSGLAEYFEMDVTLLRIIFVVLTLASGGFGLLIYLILAIVMPASEAEEASLPRGKDLGDNINNLAAEVRDSGGVGRLRNFFGFALILFGAWLLLVQFFPQWLSLNWNFVWPAALVVLGLLLLTRTRS